MDNEVDQYTPAKVVGDIVGAQYEKKRSDLRDPDVVTDAQWNALVSTYRDDSFSLDDPTTDCSTSGYIAVCQGTWYDTTTTYDERPSIMTLVKTSSTSYGWKMAKLQLG